MFLCRKQHVTLNEHISKLTPSEKELYNVKWNGDTLVTSDIILGCLQQKYGSFEMIHGESTTERISYWSNFVARYIHGFKRIYDTLATEYKPLENYDKISDITTSGRTTMSTNSESIAQATTEDSAVWNNTDRATGTGNTDGTSNTTVTERTHGNIGVTTNAQMAIGEIDLRTQHNLADIICGMYSDMELI